MGRRLRRSASQDNTIRFTVLFLPFFRKSLSAWWSFGENCRMRTSCRDWRIQRCSWSVDANTPSRCSSCCGFAACPSRATLPLNCTSVHFSRCGAGNSICRSRNDQRGGSQSWLSLWSSTSSCRNCSLDLLDNDGNWNIYPFWVYVSDSSYSSIFIWFSRVDVQRKVTIELGCFVMSLSSVQGASR